MSTTELMAASSGAFEHEGVSVRTIVKDGAVWFIAKDVCSILDLRVDNAVRGLEPDQKQNTQFEGFKRGAVIINESGLWALTLRSRTPKAKALQRKVTETILPSLRKHGGYVTGAEQLSDTEQQRLYAEMRAKVNNALRLHDHKTQHDHWLKPERRDAASLQAAHEVAQETGLPLNVVSLAASHGVDVAIKVVL